MFNVSALNRLSLSEMHNLITLNPVKKDIIEDSTPLFMTTPPFNWLKNSNNFLLEIQKL